MIFMFLFYDDEQAFYSLSREEMSSIVEAHVHYNFEVLERQAKVLEGRALHPPPAAVTVRPRGGGHEVIPGPFDRTMEALTGFYLVECESLEKAIQLAKDYPMPEGLGCIEVRPVLVTWDYSPHVDCAASPATIYRFYADVASWPEWKYGMESIELDGPLAEGTAGWMTPSGQKAMPFRIVAAAQDQGYTSETDLAEGVTLRMEHSLTPLPEGGTRITHRVTIPRAALDIYGLGFSPEFNAGMRATLQELSRRAEAAERAAQEAPR